MRPDMLLLGSISILSASALVAGQILNDTASYHFVSVNDYVSAAAPWPSARQGQAQVTLDDGETFLMCGGSDYDNTLDSSTEIQKDDCWTFDTTLTAWTELPATLPVARAGHFMVNVGDGRIMIWGGYNSTMGTLSDLLVLYPANNTIETINATGMVPQAYSYSSGFVSGDAMYVLCGMRTQGFAPDQVICQLNLTNYFWTLPDINYSIGGSVPGRSLINLYNSTDKTAEPSQYVVIGINNLNIQANTNNVFVFLDNGTYWNMLPTFVPFGDASAASIFPYASYLTSAIDTVYYENTSILTFGGYDESYQVPTYFSRLLRTMADSNGNITSQTLNVLNSDEILGRASASSGFAGGKYFVFGGGRQNIVTFSDLYYLNYTTPIGIENTRFTGLSNVTAGMSFTFNLLTFDVYENPINYDGSDFSLSVTLIQSSVQVGQNAYVTYTSNGTYAVSGVLTVSGYYDLMLAVSNQTYLWQSVLYVQPTTPDFSLCDASGDGLQYALIRRASNFNVEVYDKYRNEISDPDLAELTVNIVNTATNTIVPASITFYNDSTMVSYTKTDDSPVDITIQIGDQALFGGPVRVYAVWDTDGEPNYIDYSSQSGVVMMVLTCFGIAFSLVLLGIIIVKRKDAKIRIISPNFCIISLSGLALVFSTIFFIIGPPSNLKCAITPIWLAISVSIVFGSLLAKIWRLYVIFSSQFVKLNMKEQNMKMLFFSAHVLIQAILCIIWLVLSAPVPIVFQAGTSEHYFTCQSPNTQINSIFLAILLIYNAIVILYGAILAFLTRNLPSKYNESVTIALSIVSIT